MAYLILTAFFSHKICWITYLQKMLVDVLSPRNNYVSFVCKIYSSKKTYVKLSSIAIALPLCRYIQRSSTNKESVCQAIPKITQSQKRRSVFLFPCNAFLWEMSAWTRSPQSSHLELPWVGDTWQQYRFYFGMPVNFSPFQLTAHKY